MTTLILALGIGVLIASTVMFVINRTMPDPDETAIEERLSAMASRRRGGSAGGGDDDAPSLLVGTDQEAAADIMGKILERFPSLQDYLDQADMDMAPARFVLICGGLFIGGCVLGVVLPVPWMLGPIMGGMMMMGPIGYMMFMRARRLAKFGKQLPHALELLSRSLRAGHSLNQGIGLVGSEMQEPLSVEFSRVFEEQNFGIPIEEALEDMAQRIPNMDLRFFATAVIMQRQTGGDLAEILDKIGHLIRERIQIKGQIQALTGEGRVSGAVLLAMPPGLFVLMYKMSPDYIIQLFTEPAGRIMLMGAIGFQIVGAIAIKKIITIKV